MLNAEVHYREIIASGAAIDKAAHLFLRSVHNITIERGWLDLRREFSDNFPYFWSRGADVFDDGNPIHQYVLSTDLNSNLLFLFISQSIGNVAMAASYTARA